MLINSPLPQCSSSSTSCRFSGVIAFDELKVGRGIETGGKSAPINACRTIGDFHDNHPTTKITKTAGIALRNQNLFFSCRLPFKNKKDVTVSITLYSISSPTGITSAWFSFQDPDPMHKSVTPETPSDTIRNTSPDSRATRYAFPAQ